MMAQWDESRSVKVLLKSELGVEHLGLSASISMSIEQGVTISASRKIRAVEGIQARRITHINYLKIG
jgi:hypothetical protein